MIDLVRFGSVRLLCALCMLSDAVIGLSFPPEQIMRPSRQISLIESRRKDFPPNNIVAGRGGGERARLRYRVCGGDGRRPAFIRSKGADE